MQRGVDSFFYMSHKLLHPRPPPSKLVLCRQRWPGERCKGRKGLPECLEFQPRPCAPNHHLRGHDLQAKVVRRELQVQRGAARSQAAAVDHCILCWDSTRRHTRLALAAAQTCYLALPQR